MNWIKQFVILFVVASGVLVLRSAANPWKFRPAERYEFCVARNLSGLSMFNEEEKDRIDKIVMETSVRMHELKADPENAANTKTMLRLFAAALACVVADCESSVRYEREKACLTAIETCTKSLQEPVGKEVVNELKRIFAAMNRELSTSEAISSDSATADVKKEKRLEEEMRAEIKEQLLESEEKNGRIEKETISSEETEVKERPKRAYVEPFEFTGFNLRPRANPTLDSVIADKLLRSVTFNNFFNFRLSQNDAIFYSTSMIGTALNGYGYDVIDEAIIAVTNAINRIGNIAGPSDYAYAIARSISSTLADHELTFFADGLNIGSTLVYQLDSMLRPSSSSSFSPSLGTVSAASSGWGTSSVAVSSQTSGLASVQVNPGYIEPSFDIPSNPQNEKTQFQSRLSYLFSNSDVIAEAFCDGPFPDVYEVMNSAFADYGYAISSTIATIVKNSLSMLPTEAACAQYPEVISEIITEIFGRNDLITTADPQAITNKLSDIINMKLYPPQDPPIADQESSSSSDYPLNPSFSEYPFPAAENPEFPVFQNPGSAISSSAPNAPLQQRNPDLTNLTEISPDSSSIIQSSSKQDFSSPEELLFDGLESPVESQPSTDGSVTTNNSWVIVDHPSNVPSVFDEKNQTTGSAGIDSPLILEPGPVIPENIPEEIRSVPEYTVADRTTIAYEMTGMTGVFETTTPVPHSTSVHFSAVMPKTEVTTAVPQVALEDAFQSQSELSDFILKEMSSSLKASDEKKQAEHLKTSETSTSGMLSKAAGSAPPLGYLKPTAKPDVSTEKPPSDKVGIKTQPSTASPKVQNWQSDEADAKTPEVITDEITGLLFGERVLSIATSAIRYIRSPNFQLEHLCEIIRELAPLVDLPPLDVCSEIAVADFLLHVIRGVTLSFVGEK